MLNGLQCKDDLAGNLPRFERFDRLGGAFERVAGVNVWFQTTLCNPR